MCEDNTLEIFLIILNENLGEVYLHMGYEIFFMSYLFPCNSEFGPLLT